MHKVHHDLKRVDGCVPTCCIVALTSGAGDASTGREKDEEIHILGKIVMQIPTALDFGANSLLELFVGHILVNSILPDKG